MVLGKLIVFGVRVGGKVQRISIGLISEVRSPQPELKRGKRDKRRRVRSRRQILYSMLHVIGRINNVPYNIELLRKFYRA